MTLSSNPKGRKRTGWLCAAAICVAAATAEAAAEDTPAGPPTALEDRLAPGLPLTEAEKAAIARAKADPSSLNLGEFAALRHDLAQAYRHAADRSGDTDALRVAIFYAASAVDLNPDEPDYRATLGGLYSRYAATEVVAGFAALEAFGAAWTLKTATPPQPPGMVSGAVTLLRDHQHRMRADHLARTYQDLSRRVYRSVLSRVGPGPTTTDDDTRAPLDDDTRRLLTDELADLAEIQGNFETRQTRWRARLAELEKNQGAAAVLALDNVRSQLSRLETEAAARRTVREHLEAWIDGEAKSAHVEPDGSAGEPSHPRPALVVAREIMSLTPSPAAHGVPEAAGPDLAPDLAALIATARKARARGWVEPVLAHSAADNDLLERLSRVAALSRRPKPELGPPAAAGVAGTSAPGDAAAVNLDAPPAPMLRLVYGSRRATGPQTDRDPRFARIGPVDGSVPVGAKLTLEADIKIAEADPQPWIGFAWVLYDMNRVNTGPVDVGPTVAFNQKGAAQLGGHRANHPIEATLRKDLPTAALAPGPYAAVIATFYLGEDGAFDADRALRTTALSRVSFEIVEGEIGVHVDLPDRLASPGWSPLTTVASDWAQTPYTIDVTLDNLVFRDAGNETRLSVAGLSPVVKIGGVMTVPDAPPDGKASVTVRVTDARGRSANATHHLIIGGPPQTVFTPTLAPTSN
jgi:hypothetical protein